MYALMSEIVHYNIKNSLLKLFLVVIYRTSENGKMSNGTEVAQRLSQVKTEVECVFECYRNRAWCEKHEYNEQMAICQLLERS